VRSPAFGERRQLGKCGMRSRPLTAIGRTVPALMLLITSLGTAIMK
jgi:hypothetical protein